MDFFKMVEQTIDQWRFAHNLEPLVKPEEPEEEESEDWDDDAYNDPRRGQAEGINRDNRGRDV
jgi:hypothetical protein